MLHALPLREAFVVLVTLVSAAWLRRHELVPPGRRRFGPAAPVLAAFLAAPLLFDPFEPAQIVMSINYPWIGTCAVRGSHRCFNEWKAWFVLLTSTAPPSEPPHTARGTSPPHAPPFVRRC